MLERIGKYEIKLQIGRGAMGVVYEAWDTLIERRVALKTLRTDQIEDSQVPGLLARFKREAQAAGRLSHPHIVTIHDYGVDDGTPYLVMEFVSGRELAHDLQRRARFPLEDVVRIMTQLLGALAHAHEHGVVHRDLKPANMFLLDDGSLKVVDFGVARVDESDFTVLTSDGAVLGTPAYMSPEQVDSVPLDHRSDLFSAGIILYELLVGERPFTGESVHTVKQKVRSQEPLRPSEANPTLAPAWDRVVSRALAKKPAARYENARQFAEAIKAAHQAERSHAEESRLKAAEANEHVLRAAEERSRAEALRRADEDRRAAEQRAKAESDARKAAEERARRAAQEKVGAAPAAPPPAPAAPTGATPRLSAVAAAVVVAALAIGGYLYVRQSADSEAAKAEAARVAAETRARGESEKRARAEVLAREESEKRLRLEADAKAQAEAVARARAEEDAKKVAEEKAKALALKKEEDERRKLEAAAKKEAEAKARSEDEARRKAAEARQSARWPGAVFQDCPDCPRMVVIPAGEFVMGSPDSEAGRDADEGPQRTVRIAPTFAMGRTEVTQGEWRALMGVDASRFSRFSNCGADCPVEQVSWNDAREFARQLSEKTGKRYRLPTEAEWEYACRAGGSDLYCGGSGVDALAWYSANSGSRTQPVAQKRPNAFGLYDMSGNVYEWTADCWNGGYSGAPSDGRAWLTGDCSLRVLRGGSWSRDPRNVRSANRGRDSSGHRSSGLGFRLARTLE